MPPHVNLDDRKISDVLSYVRQSWSNDAPQNDFIHSHTGMRYFTLLVKDLTPVLARIKDRKIKLLGETPVPLGASSHFILIQDPDGTFVELIGPMKTTP